MRFSEFSGLKAKATEFKMQLKNKNRNICIFDFINNNILMPILRTIKNEYEFFHHQKLDIIVALDAENKEIVSSFWKNNKGKKQLLNVPVKVKGYKMIKDEEFETLKIDFNEQFQFDAAELSKAKFQ